MRDNPSTTFRNVEDGYQSHVNEGEVYPHRVFGTNIQSSMILRPSITIENWFHLCGLMNGFLISLQMPDETVDVLKNLVFLPLDQSSLFLIKPKVVDTSNGLRSYSPEVRGCYFRSERQLRFFKSYSQQKCELECLANFTKNECNCVPFYMPSN